MRPFLLFLALTSLGGSLAQLTGMTMSRSFSPSFNASTFNYSVTLPASVPELNLTVTYPNSNISSTTVYIYGGVAYQMVVSGVPIAIRSDKGDSFITQISMCKTHLKRLEFNFNNFVPSFAFFMIFVTHNKY
jgi:hypothetical protein